MERAPRLDLDRLEGRSPNPSICPFLRVEGAAGALIAPVESPYGGNCCAALASSRAVGGTQQEIVCLSGSFATCPLYARGVARLATRRSLRTRRAPLALRAGGILLGVLAASVAGHTFAGNAHPAAPEGAASRVAAVYAALEPCPDGADCYVWLVRDGETLPDIARRLDQPLTALLALNPGVVSSGELRVGDRLRVPPPGV